jgi:acetyl esterase/lipase
MHQEKIALRQGKAYMTTYIHERSQNGQQMPKRPAVIVVPGGAYAVHADEEAEPVALTFLARGYNTFILYYSLKQESAYPHTLLEAAEAVKTVREHAAEWGIDPKQVYIMGFSAGAHTAAMLASQWKSSGAADMLGCRPETIRPDRAVLCYGAMNINPQNEDMKQNPELPAIKTCDSSFTDIVQSISRDTVPLFLWHCRYDHMVPAVHSMKVAEKMMEYNRPFELHIFQSGDHMMSVNNRLTDPRGKQIDESVSQWVPLCDAWLRLKDSHH